MFFTQEVLTKEFTTGFLALYIGAVAVQGALRFSSHRVGIVELVRGDVMQIASLEQFTECFVQRATGNVVEPQAVQVVVATITLGDVIADTLGGLANLLKEVILLLRRELLAKLVHFQHELMR